MLRLPRTLAVLVFCAGLLSACSDRGLDPVPEQNLFERYVALGNSITAGVQSDGLNDSTQVETYPVMLARRANARFDFARLAKPGCPAPLIGPIGLTATRVGGGGELSCAGFITPVPAVVQNLAFPGFKIADALTTPAFPVSLVYNQAFGARSLVQAMIDAKPSLVSVWLGNNDALNAATSGDAGRLTALADFQASLNAITTAIANQTSAREAILIGVIDPTLAPIVQPGAFFWAAKQDPATAGLLPKPVNGNCAPSSPLSANLVSLRVIGDRGVQEISCADDAPYVLNAAERQAITRRVGDFNAAIRARADAGKWIYVDPNDILNAALATPNQLRKCQGLPGSVTAEQAVAALRTTCPHPSAPNFFGTLVSFDGVHPAAEGHRLIADAIAAELRTKHGITL